MNVGIVLPMGRSLLELSIQSREYARVGVSDRITFLLHFHRGIVLGHFFGYVARQCPHNNSRRYLSGGVVE